MNEGAVDPRTVALVDRAWVRIERWLGAHAPEVARNLAPGAAAADVDALEALLGRPLPGDVRASLARHDGQLDPGEHKPLVSGSVLGVDLLSTGQVASTWQQWRRLDAQNAALGQTTRSEPAGHVHPLYTHAGWVPLTHDGGGNHLGVDLTPGPLGRVGQVIVFGRDEDTKYVAAESWAAFLAWVADELESGNVAFDPVEGATFERPPVAHLHERIAFREPARPQRSARA